jgi:tetratricopeptide (TPR) repeat protein
MALDRYDNVIMEYEKLNIAYPDNADIERRLTELKRQGISIEGGGKRHGSVEANYGVCLDKGAELFARGEFNKAIAELRLAKKDDKFSRNASVLLVKCYLRKDLIDLAREEYAELQIEGEFISGDLKDVTYDLARVLEEKGQFNDALKLYDLICKVDIGFKDVFDKFEELHDYVKRF